jgi:hypothetical protein
MTDSDADTVISKINNDKKDFVNWDKTHINLLGLSTQA